MADRSVPALDETSPEESARQAGLIYVTDDEPGIVRKPWGRGFTYLDENGDHLQDEEERERIKALAIPPAWTDVWICPSPRGHLLVTGRDDAGRKQYIYHPDWEAQRQRQKFDRLIPFGEALPAIRARCSEFLAVEGLTRERVLALVVRLLDRTLIRIGHPEYAEVNETFGLASMRDEHVLLDGGSCTFCFTGKSGKDHEILLDDADLAHLIEQCRDVPGEPLFQFVHENGDHAPIDASSINNFLKEITEQEFTAKDFRTWGGTLLAARELCALEPPESPDEADKQLPDLVKKVAEVLGNTPAICRQYYIHPGLFSSYRDGSFHELWPGCCTGDPPEHMKPDEAGVLAFLRKLPKSV